MGNFKLKKYKKNLKSFIEFFWTSFKATLTSVEIIFLTEGISDLGFRKFISQVVGSIFVFIWVSGIVAIA